MRAPRLQAFPVTLLSHLTLFPSLFSFLSRPQAINLLPANTQINDIRIFLEKVLEENAQKKRFNQVLKNLLHAEFLRVGVFQAQGWPWTSRGKAGTTLPVDKGRALGSFMP